MTERAADVVCFGVITPATLLTVEDLPPWNTGATVSRVDEFISDDAAIAKMLLRRWEVRSALIGRLWAMTLKGGRRLKG